MASTADALYKQLFSHPEIVRDLVAGFLSADWAQQLEVGAFERVNASYTSEQGKARHEDVVWRARIGGEWVYVYILLEFQSRPDKWMALRMQVYIGLLYQDLVAQHKLSKHGKLPPVLPIVFYHGRRPWRAATQLSELMLPPPDELANFQAQQRYLLLDQCHDYGHSNIVSLLFRLLHSRTVADARAAAVAFTERMRQPDLEPARASLANWLRLTLIDESGGANLNAEEDLAMPKRWKFTFDEVFNEEFFASLKARADDAWRQGIQEGKQAGMRQGMQEGRQEGMQQGRQEGMQQGRQEGMQQGRQEGMQQGMQEGMQQGMQEGMQQGMQEGMQQGMQEGMQQGERLALQALLRDALAGLDMPLDVAAKIADADSSQLRAWINSLIAGVSPRQLFAEG